MKLTIIIPGRMKLPTDGEVKREIRRNERDWRGGCDEWKLSRERKMGRGLGKKWWRVVANTCRRVDRCSETSSSRDLHNFQICCAEKAMKNSGSDVGTRVVERRCRSHSRFSSCASAGERKKGGEGEWTSPAGKILRFKRLENCPNCHAA